MEEIEKKEIPIEWKGKKEVVVIKKLEFGEVNEIRHQSTKKRFIGTTMQIDMNEGIWMEMSIFKSLMKAPFKIELQVIKKLPNKLGLFLYNEIDKYNKLSELKKGS